MFHEKMSESRLLLFNSSFTCIYFPLILILLNYNESLYTVGQYRFIPILIILLFAEAIKLLFSVMNNDSHNRMDSRLLSSSLPSSSSYRSSRKSWSKMIKDLFRFLVIMILICMIYYTIIVLFGAPLFTHHEETTMLTLTLVTLTFIAPCLHLGVDITVELLTGNQTSINNNQLAKAIYSNIKCTLIGCWLGAIVIPLDWDRPWQKWPIPCVISALFGYLISHYITLIQMLPIFKVFNIDLLSKKFVY